jgi:3-deoxy-D-manno-octulosonic-acid transferase
LIAFSFKKKYKKSIPARFFLINNPPFSKKSYWIHACSLGEVRAVREFIKKLNANVSVITETGFNEAKKYANEVRFLPYEIFLPFWVKECKTLIVVEAELWYMLFKSAKNKGCKTVLLNARISDKSYPKYLKFKWFYKKIFENIDLVLAQTEKDKKRLIELGAKNVEVVGNIKTVFNPIVTKKYQKSKPLIVVASTHKGEEEEILKNLPKNYQIVVVPRHPERFDEVEKIMKKFGKVSRLSKEDNLNGDLILCDMMGELINLYNVADIVILGGSFVDNVGGHNPIEAAYFNVPIISGKYVFNQKALYNEIENIQICEIDEIKEAIKKAKPTKIKRRVNLESVLKRIESV